MKFVWYSIVFLACAVFNCCNNKKGNASLSIIVLCDVSNSITHNTNGTEPGREVSINSMKALCKKVIKSAPPHSIVSFYKVSSSMTERPLLTTELSAVNKNQVYGEAKRVNNLCDSIANLLELNGKNAEKNTCLLTSLLHAYDLIKQQSHDRTRSFRLVVLSDMFEECDTSPIEGKPVKMSKKAGNPFLTPETWQLIKNYQPKNINLDQYPVELELVLLSNHMEPHIRGQIEETWRFLLGEKFGFSKALDSNYSFLKDDYNYKERSFLK